MGNYVKEVAILALAVVEMYALSIGIDGALLSLFLAAVAGLGGYELGKQQQEEKKK